MTLTGHPEPQTSYMVRNNEPVDNTLVFLHLQKCAGTTLHRIIEEQFIRLYGKETLSSIPLHWWPFDKQLKNILTFKGHFNFGQEERMLLPETELPRTYITLLRNPVDRVLSGYHFHFIRYRTYTQYDGQMISFTDFLKGNYLINSNLMTYQLGGHQENIHRALENLHKFDVVGIAEDFDGFLKQLNKKLGWSEDYTYERCNVQADKLCRKDLSDEDYNLCVKVNQNDFTLYEEAVKIWRTNEV